MRLFLEEYEEMMITYMTQQISLLTQRLKIITLTLFSLILPESVAVILSALVLKMLSLLNELQVKLD